MDFGFWLLDHLARYHSASADLSIESSQEIQKILDDTDYNNHRLERIREESIILRNVYDFEKSIFKIFYT